MIPAPRVSTGTGRGADLSRAVASGLRAALDGADAAAVGSPVRARSSGGLRASPGSSAALHSSAVSSSVRAGAESDGFAGAERDGGLREGAGGFAGEDGRPGRTGAALSALALGPTSSGSSGDASSESGSGGLPGRVFPSPARRPASEEAAGSGAADVRGGGGADSSAYAPGAASNRDATAIAQEVRNLGVTDPASHGATSPASRTFRG